MRITVKKGNAVIEVDDHTTGRSIPTCPETIKQLITDMAHELKEIITYGESRWDTEIDSKE